MRYKVHGPYEIGVDSGQESRINRGEIQDLWEQVGGELQEACGVYLFGMRGSGTYKNAGKNLPWYVGKAEKQTFKQECFNGRNRDTFNEILATYKKKGKPFLYLLARQEDDEYSKPAANKPHRDVGLVEELFIQLSLSINNDLKNISATKMARRTSIRGLLNTNKRTSEDVDHFKSMFGIRDREPAQVAGDIRNTKFKYGVFGPYDVPYKKASKAIEKKHVQEMWDFLREKKKGLDEACGVYVIGMRNDGAQGGNTTPWYIGTAEKISFEERCFELPGEKGIAKKRGSPVIYFLPKLGKDASEFAKPRQTMATPGDMDYVVRVLIEYGIQKNAGILLEPAALHLKALQSVSVDGFVKSKKGKPSKAVSELKSLLRL